MSVRPLTTSAYAILGLLAYVDRQISGYDLWRLCERSVGAIWTPAKSQIYKVLPRLVTAGLAEVETVEQTERPDKQLYRLTPAGRRRLRAWLEEPDPTGDPDLHVLKVFLGRHGSRAALLANVEAYHDALALEHARYSRLHQTLTRRPENRLPLRTLELGLRRTRAGLEWAEDLARDLRAARTPAR
jgi:PadR family transcriptional regulator AphA